MRYGALAACIIALAVGFGCKKNDSAATVTRDWNDELALTPDRSIVDIAGTPPASLWAVGDGLFRRDKTTWREISFPSRPRTLRAVATVGDEVWAVGQSGTVAHFDAKIWKLERVGGEGHTADLVDVLAWPQEVWAIAQKGEIWRRRAGAWESWKPAELSGENLGAAWGTGPERVFVSTKNGVADWNGKAWRVSELGADVTIRAVHGAAPDDVWAVGERPRSFGKGAVLHHFDGAKWTATEPPVDAALSSVHARSRSEVWAAGERGTLLFFDGSTWRKVEGLPAGTVTQVFAPAGGPLLVNIAERRIARAR